MLQRILFCVVILFTITTYSSSQNNFSINGPTETCVGACEYYRPNINFQDPEYSITVQYLSGGTGQDTLCRSLYTYEDGSFQVCFYCEGEYKIKGSYSDAAGNIITDSLLVLVFPYEPIIVYPVENDLCNSMINGCYSVCGGGTYQYKYIASFFQQVDIAVSGAISYDVDYNIQIITVTWAETGSGYINVFSLGIGGCSSEGGICVAMIDKIDVDFTVPGLDFCVGEQIPFTPSTYEGGTYTWDFGNGEVSTDINSIAAYDAPGTYLVSLSVVNDCGCQGSITKEVTIKDNYLPTINCTSTICENTEMTYQTDADCGVFHWKVIGDGTILAGGGTSDRSITIDWGAGPLGIIELEVESCTFDLCPKKAIFDIPIISENATVVGPSIACKGSSEIYTIQKYDGTEYNWSVTGGAIIAGQASNTIIVSWDNGGQGTINVNYNNCYLKCGGSDEMSVLLKNTYKLSIDNDQLCVGELATARALRNNVPVIIENWTVTSETGAILYTDANVASIQYQVPLGVEKIVITTTTQNYCNSEQTIAAYALPLSPLPKGIIGELAICKGNDYVYSVDANLTNANYLWTITDGGATSTQTGENIIVQWNSDGPYELTLSQIDLDGQNCYSGAINILPKPIESMDLTGDDASCLYDTYVISATLYESLEYQWEIIPSDAATIISEVDNNLTVKWSQAGSHMIKLTTCAGVFMKEIVVNALPDPIIVHPLTLCEGTSTMVNTSVAYDSYKWFNENRQLISQNAAPELTAGSFINEVMDVNGCSNSKSFTITQLPKPNIYLSTPDETNVCLTNPVVTYPTLYSLDAEDGYTYEWLKDGLSIGSTAQILNPTDIGIYQVQVIDDFGCTNISNPLRIFDLCDTNNPGDTIKPCISLANINFNYVANDCNTWQFTSTNVGTISGSYIWDFNDSSSASNMSTLADPIHDFSNAGYFKVRHSAMVNDENNIGNTCIKSIYKVVEVPIKADFDYVNACQGAEIQFFDRSTFIPTMDITSWEWDFGDALSGASNTSNLPDPIHIFVNEGTYTISLTISNGSCTDQLIKTITLHPQPKSDIVDLNANCAGETTKFELDDLSDILSLDWDFGDAASGSNNVQESVEAYHQYGSAGTYLVSAALESIFGCQATVTALIEIQANTLAGEITSSLGTEFCAGPSTTLASPLGGQQWKWNTGTVTKDIQVSKAGIYSVAIRNEFGCQYKPEPIALNVLSAPKTTIVSTVIVDGIEQRYFGDQISFCKGSDFIISVVEIPNTTVKWQNNSSAASLQYLDNAQLGVGSYTFSVILTNTITGCTNAIGPIQVVVNGPPADFSISADNNGILCEGIEYTLSINSPISNLDYLWNTGQKTTVINSSVAGTYFVKATNANGCSSLSNEIEISTGPDESFVPSGCYERCAPDTLCFPPIPDVASYQWFNYDMPVDVDSGGQDPYIIFQESGSYTLKLLGDNGCFNTTKPLFLTLNPPVGVINGRVYSDVNANNIIDAGDTLVQNVDVVIPGFGQTTDSNGAFSFEEIPAGTYYVQIKESSLPVGAKAIIDSLSAIIATCDDSASVDLLINFDCFVSNVIEKHLVCYGNTFEIEGVTITKDSILSFDKVNSVGCLYKDIHEVTFTEEIVFSAVATPTCPELMTGSISIDVQSNGVYSYLLDGLPVVVAMDNVIYDLGAGPHTLELVDADNCPSSTQLDISEKPNVAYDIVSENITCTDNTANLQVKVLNYPLDEVTIVWSNGGTEAQTSVTDKGIYLVEISNGCITTTESIEVTAPETNNIFNKFIICSGNDYELLGQKYASDTTVYRTMVNAEGCIDSMIYQLQFGQKFDYILDVDGTCPGVNDGKISFTMNTPGVFEYLLDDTPLNWSPNGLVGLESGQYILSINDQIGCAENIEIKIEDKKPVDYTLESEDITCFKGFAELSVDIINYAVEDLEINWSNGKDGQSTQVNTAGEYTLQISNGCTTETQKVLVSMSDAEPLFTLPNIFSPNQDGYNDIINLQNSDFKDAIIKSFYVFERGGRAVHHSTNQIWDGGGNLLPGVYFYLIEADVDICGQSKSIRRTGSITIIR